MSDIREQLAAVIGPLRSQPMVPSNQELADAILERFEVTPKPVISDALLGQLLAGAHDGGRPYYREQGQMLRLALEEAGLRIVRSEEGAE